MILNILVLLFLLLPGQKSLSYMLYVYFACIRPAFIHFFLQLSFPNWIECVIIMWLFPSLRGFINILPNKLIYCQKKLQYMQYVYFACLRPAFIHFFFNFHIKWVFRIPVIICFLIFLNICKKLWRYQEKNEYMKIFRLLTHYNRF